MSLNQGNVFSSKNLCKCMLSSLPPDASPHLRDPYDAVALLSHACMMAVGFRLEGLGEDHRIGIFRPSPKPSLLRCQHHLTPFRSPIRPLRPRPIPSSWNSDTSSNYAFRYAHTQSSLHYILKASRLGSKAIINALGIGDEKVYTLEVPIKDFLSPSSFPFTATISASSTPTAADDKPPLETEENELRLTACFISAGRITDLAAMLKLQIIQKLAPGLRKEGYEESAHAASTNTSGDRQREQPPPERDARDPRPAGYDPLRDDPLPPVAQPRPFHDPLVTEPRRPYPPGDFPPPGFEDEYEMNRPPGRGGFGGEGRRPLNIGERDLYPPGLGPHDPLRGGPGFGGIGGGGGMHPTFDDPLFGGNGAIGGGAAGRAPPGARYDPVGPGDGPPNLRGGPRFPGGGGAGGPPNPFGGFGGGDFI